MSFAVSAVTGPPPVAQPRPVADSTETDANNSAQIAALQKELVALQRQRSDVNSSDSDKSSAKTKVARNDAVRSGSDNQVKQIDDQISGVQSQIAILRQQAASQTAKKALASQDSDEARSTANQVQPTSTDTPAKSPSQTALEDERRQELAVNRAAEQGLMIGTNVDTYA